MCIRDSFLAATSSWLQEHPDIDASELVEVSQEDLSRASLLKEKMYFDVNVLDADRQRITDKLLRNGYYKFNKDYICLLYTSYKPLWGGLRG